MSERQTAVGFTGTRVGLQTQQAATIRGLLIAFDWLHHGDCLGADYEVHKMAVELGLAVHVHPPINPTMRAFLPGRSFSECKEYIARNRDLVNETNELIAAPRGFQQIARSGTWSTVCYARKHGKRVTIVYPDGSVEFGK